MGDKPAVKVNDEAMRELRNDFTFFIAMSMLKSMATSTPNPGSFVKDIILKWRELQVNALGMMAADVEKKMFSDPEFNDLFGEFVKKVNKAQREILVESIRTFCDGLEKVLLTSLEDTEENKGEDEFSG